MNFNQKEVALSYQIAGAQLFRGEYLDNKGKFVVKKEPKFSKCTVHVKLSSSFCEYHSSEESRPNKYKHIRAYSGWKIMKPMDRLKWHIVKYAHDMGAIGKINFKIN